MQCPACLCSTNHETEIDSTTYRECTFCGNLMVPERPGQDDPAPGLEELKRLRLKLKEADQVAERIMRRLLAVT